MGAVEWRRQPDDLYEMGIMQPQDMAYTYPNSSGQLEIVLGGAIFLTSTAQLTSGVRERVAIVKNAGTWSLYLNGVQYSVTNATYGGNTPSTGFYIGNRSISFMSFNGIISNVAVWTMPRSAAQLQADMNTCAIAPQSGLAGYWSLERGLRCHGDRYLQAVTEHNLSLQNTSWSATSGLYLCMEFRRWRYKYIGRPYTYLYYIRHFYTYSHRHQFIWMYQ